MQLGVAKKIVLQEFDFVRNNPEYDSLEFNFMGGEPLIAFSLICDIVEWTYQLKTDIPFIFFVVTNGTLLDDEKKRWLEKNKDKIVLGLSVDGLSDMQKRNRGCNLDQLPINWAHSLWPDQQFKMTVSKDTIKDFANGVLFLQRRKFIVQTTLALGIEWSMQDAEDYSDQLEIVSTFYLSHKEFKPMPMLTKNIESLFYTKSLREKCCNAGTRAITYDVNGSSYPCIVFTPIVFGKDIQPKISKINFKNDDIFFDNECQDCFIKNMCKTCYGLKLRNSFEFSKY
jgi:uncharacterized protein